MRFLKRILLFALAAVCLSTTALAAGSVAITYNDGGTIQAPEGVRFENGILYVDDDGPVEFLVIPDEGCEVRSVYLNDQEMGISGAGTKTVTVDPEGGAVRVHVMFARKVTAEDINQSNGTVEGPSEVTETPSAQPNGPDGSELADAFGNGTEGSGADLGGINIIDVDDGGVGSVEKDRFFDLESIDLGKAAIAASCVAGAVIAFFVIKHMLQKKRW